MLQVGKQDGRGLNINELSQGCQPLLSNCSQNTNTESEDLVLYGTQSSAVLIDKGTDYYNMNSENELIGNNLVSLNCDIQWLMFKPKEARRNKILSTQFSNFSSKRGHK